MRQYVQLKDVALGVMSIATAAVIPADNGVPAQTAHGVFIILKVRVRDVSHVPLDWETRSTDEQSSMRGATSFL
jgi:hypothetical protein